MLHNRTKNYAGPRCEGTSRLIVADKFDALADADRGSQKGRFAKTTPGMRAAGPFARRRGGAYQKHTIQHIASDEGLGGTRIEERHASVGRNGVPSLCIEIAVVNETSSSVTVPPTRQGPCSDSARPRLTPEAIAKTSWLWSAGACEKLVENSEGGPWQALATVNGHDGGTDKIS